MIIEALPDDALCYIDGVAYKIGTAHQHTFRWSNGEWARSAKTLSQLPTGEYTLTQPNTRRSTKPTDFALPASSLVMRSR